MKPAKDWTGRKFGRLTVTNSFAGHRGRALLVKCSCACGMVKIISRNSLRSGNCQSCGCLKIIGKIKHGKSRTMEYKSWSGMMRRCYEKSSAFFNYYGERGISVCQRWHHFENFLSDMGVRTKGQSLDRINNNGDYNPSNCRWASHLQQANNMSVNIRLSHDGQTMTISQWARHYGVKYKTYRKRVLRGLSVIEAASQINFHTGKPLYV